MFIIFPISHEDQIIRRLPVCTIGIMVLCLLVHLYSLFIVRSDNEILQKAHNAMRNYYFAHSDYLDYPNVFDKYIPSEEWEANHPESSLVSPEQKEFNRLIIEYLRAFENTFYYRFGFVPGHWNFGIITYQFIHGGWLHLITNMWFLWLAGTVLEDIWGRLPFAAFYLLCGIFAASSHGLFFAQSSEPLIGASGSIAGVMGAFLIKYHKTRIRFFWALWLFISARHGTFHAPASIMLILWLIQQIAYAVADPGGLLGVGFIAHIGGFIFGAAVALGLKSSGLEQKYLLSHTEALTSYTQNQYIVNAMDSLEKCQYDEAEKNLTLLLRKEPQNMDALLLMFQLARKKMDAQAATLYLASLIDNHLQKKEFEPALQLYRENSYQYPELDLSLASVIALVNHFKSLKDYESAFDLLQKTVRQHPDDMTGFKALSNYAELCSSLEKYEDAGKAYSVLLSKILPPEFHQYIREKYDQIQAFLPTHLEASVKEKTSQPQLLIKEMKIAKVSSDGIVIQINDEEKMILWNRIHYLSTARVKNLENQKPYHDYIILDLINTEGYEKIITIYRTFSFSLNLALLFPEMKVSSMDKFLALLKEIAMNSRCIMLHAFKPEEQLFTLYTSIDTYNESITTELIKRG